MVITLTGVASIATAIGVLIGAEQIRLSKKQANLAFEDSLAKEYRDLAGRLPTKALLGEPLSEDEFAECFDEMYHYFDLCNHQAFLAQLGRISKQTWTFWKEGISSNMARPAFERAWSEIAGRSNHDFSELRSIIPPKPYSSKNTLRHG